ncbi:MAG: methyltransferase domain-containing protein [bacterium]|nr:methyltransferase domain-containing protein [bacterium]
MVLENRGRSRGYRELLGAMMAATSLKPGDSALEVGCGSGAVMRWLAKYTDGQNELTGIDINAYLLAEGNALAQKEGSDALITTKKGSALSIPFPDNSFDVTYSVTVIEEVEADPMIAEMIRVTKPGGQVAVICRASDLPWVRNVPIEPDLKAKIEANHKENASEGACADASLYRRFRDAGLKSLITFPHFTPFTSSDPEIVSFIQAGILAGLTPEETQSWHTARARAEKDGSFVLAWPHHCAVGTKG